VTRHFDEAVATVRARRKALQATAQEVRARVSPPQLAEDALSLLDPELALLGRAKERILHNRLLSLAVLAGVGWLVGAPRHHDGDPFAAETAGRKPPRAHMKEKNNDSGQIHGDHWSGTGAGRQEDRRPEERTEEAVRARRREQAQPSGGVTPLHREPQQGPAGERDEVTERQPERQP